MKNGLKSGLYGLAGLVASAAPASALTLHQYEPMNVGSTVLIQSDLENNDGFSYNSATLNYSDFLGQVANLPENILAYSDDSNDSNNLSDFISANYNSGEDSKIFFNINDDGVDFGWGGSLNTDGTVDITNVGGIAGITYDNWNSSSDPNRMLTQLELDESLIPQDKYSIALGAAPTISNFSTAYDSGIGSSSTNGRPLNVAVPEPQTYALMAGLMSLGLAVYRRNQKKD